MKHFLILDDENNKVTLLASGEQALQKINTADLIFNNIGIDELDGIKALEDIKDNNEIISKIYGHIQLEDYHKNLETIISEKTAVIEKMQDAIISSFAELVEVRDGETGGHVQRTAGYLEILANEMMKSGVYSEQLTPSYIKQLKRSATLHDIGKIGISDSTLLKETRLSDNEREYMKMHTTLGAKALAKAIEKTEGENFLYAAYDMALSHHEWWNGKGYPNGLSGTKIPLCARIIAIADVYDALTSERPYHKQMSHAAALEIILEGRGTQFDPSILDVFNRINDEFQQASLIYHS